jgi:hypothetical protein
MAGAEAYSGAPRNPVGTRPSAIRAGIRAVSEQPDAGGVFGNLPRSRPGTRSPLREGEHAARKRAATDERESAADTPSGSAGRQDAPAEAAQPADDEPSASDQREPGGLEDLAWAGIAAAAEAATIGVRLASRAMEAVRDAGKRS